MTADHASNVGAAVPAKRPRGRRPDSDVDEKVKTAACVLLREGGFQALNFETISQMTGISRPAIYRRWPSKAHLANDVANSGDVTLAAVGARANLASKIEAFVSQIYDQYRRPEVAAAAAGLIVAYDRKPELRRELHNNREASVRGGLRAIITQAQTTGEIRAAVDADALFDIAVGAMIFRLLYSSLAADRSLIDDVCAIILNGIAPPAL